MKKLWLRFRLVFPLGKEKLLEDNAHEQRYVETIKGYLKETEANWFLYFQSELEKMDEPDDGACIDPLLRSINVTNAISPKAIMASYVHIITLLGQAYRNSADLAIRKQFRTLQSSIMRNYLTLSHDKYGDNKFTLSDGQVLDRANLPKVTKMVTRPEAMRMANRADGRVIDQAKADRSKRWREDVRLEAFQDKKERERLQSICASLSGHKVLDEVYLGTRDPVPMSEVAELLTAFD